VTTDTERILLNALEGLRADVTELTREVSGLRERAAHEDGLDRGLALARRVDTLEAEVTARPTAEQIGEMLDERLRKLAVRMFIATPLWLGAAVAVATYLSR
jgi:hypothetical protein